MRRSKSFLNPLRVERLEDRTVPSAVLRWNTIANDVVRDDHALGGTNLHFGPTRAARALAIVHAAVYDAVNSIDRSFQPYQFQVAAPFGASIDAAVARAAHDALVSLYPPYQSSLDSFLAQDLAAIPNVNAAQQGASVGQQVAAMLLANRANDGSDATVPYSPSGQFGRWEPDPMHPTQKALTPGWGSVAPFTMTSGSQFRAPAPPAFNSPEYAAAFNEVKQYGGDGVNSPTIRNAEQTEIGIYWGYDGQPGLCSPPRLYNQIANQIAAEKGNTDVQNARLFALLNLAMADAGIASWESKYFYDLCRPISAIRTGSLDGNPNTIEDGNWMPLGAPADNGSGTNFSPPFPAYTSGHATFGGAVFRSIANFYGTDKIPFTFVSDEFNGKTFDMNGDIRPVRPRHFDTLTQAEDENGQSRIYLGIHYAFDKTAGIAQGNAIADHVFKNFLRANPNVQRYATAAGPGGGPHVQVFDSSTGTRLFSFYAFDQSFAGGVRVAMGDVNGDGTPDIIAGAGPGGGPHVKVFDGKNLNLLQSFFAYDSSFRGGVFVAAGDVDGDGKADVITGADAGGGPHVRAVSGADGTQLRSFFAYSSQFSGGVRVAAGDINGDGRDDIITGAGPGGGPHVEAFSGVNGELLQSFYAYAANFLGGVSVSAGDTDGDGKADIVTGAGAGGTPHVLVYNNAGAVLQSFLAFGNSTSNGVRVGAVDFDGDGRADLLTAAARRDKPLVETFDAVKLSKLSGGFAFDPSFLGGVFVGGA